MVVSYGAEEVEKVTFNIPLRLKRELLKVKEEEERSLSSLYTEAIADFLKRRELKRWDEGVEAARREGYGRDDDSLGESIGELYEY